MPNVYVYKFCKTSITFQISIKIPTYQIKFIIFTFFNNLRDKKFNKIH